MGVGCVVCVTYIRLWCSLESRWHHGYTMTQGDSITHEVSSSELRVFFPLLTRKSGFKVSFYVTVFCFPSPVMIAAQLEGNPNVCKKINKTKTKSEDLSEIVQWTLSDIILWSSVSRKGTIALTCPSGAEDLLLQQMWSFSSFVSCDCHSWSCVFIKMELNKLRDICKINGLCLCTW